MRIASTLILLAVLIAVGWYYRSTQLTPHPTPSPTVTDTTSDALAVIGSTSNDETTLETGQVLLPVENVNEPLTVEAQAFIETLTETHPEPLAVQDVDHFVRSDQTLSLISPELIEQADVYEVLSDPSLTPDSPITVVKEIEQVEMISPSRLIAESGGNLDQTISILAEGQKQVVTVREALQTHTSSPTQSISLITKVRHYQITTPKELATNLDQTVKGEDLIGIIKKPYRLEAASIEELLIEEQLLDEESIYYIRTVKPEDTQGIWGILHSGLISNFLRGVAIERGEEVNTYQVAIPELADEILDDASSSYLGRLIHGKTVNSYVYNFKENRMGKNPHSLIPGQEIVIVKFSPDELIEIYKHFVKSEG